VRLDGVCDVGGAERCARRLKPAFQAVRAGGLDEGCGLRGAERCAVRSEDRRSRPLPVS